MHLYYLAFGSSSGGCCPWWSFCSSCDIGCCRCPGGQVGCLRRCFVQTAPPSGEPCGWGRCSCRTRRWYRLTGCRLSVWVDHFSLSVHAEELKTFHLLHYCHFDVDRGVLPLLFPEVHNHLLCFVDVGVAPNNAISKYTNNQQNIALCIGIILKSNIWKWNHLGHCRPWKADKV